MLVVSLIGVALWLTWTVVSLRSRSPIPRDSTRQYSGASYEDTVRDQQKQWGHGHTIGDPPPAERTPTR